MFCQGQVFKIGQQRIIYFWKYNANTKVTYKIHNFEFTQFSIL